MTTKTISILVTVDSFRIGKFFPVKYGSISNPIAAHIPLTPEFVDNYEQMCKEDNIETAILTMDGWNFLRAFLEQGYNKDEQPSANTVATDDDTDDWE